MSMAVGKWGVVRVRPCLLPDGTWEAQPLRGQGLKGMIGVGADVGEASIDLMRQTRRRGIKVFCWVQVPAVRAKAEEDEQ